MNFKKFVFKNHMCYCFDDIINLEDFYYHNHTEYFNLWHLISKTFAY